MTRLAWEQARYLGSATPVTRLLATTEQPERRQALETLVEVREFAIKAGLDVGGSYRKVADTGSATPFQVVTAAYQDRLQAYTWWYPVVGAIPYRGYFDRASAQSFAAQLAGEGLDTMIVEASAYSTLGWFDDPLPSSVVDRGDGAVVVTVLHELVHQTFFAPGEIAFNETLATAVAWRLVSQFLEQRGEGPRARRAEDSRVAWLGRSDALDAAALRLDEFFAASRAESKTRQEMLAARTAVYAEVVAGLARVDSEFVAKPGKESLDNASFLAEHRYATHARAIDDWLATQPSMAAALGALRQAHSRGENLYAFVSATPLSAAGPPVR